MSGAVSIFGSERRAGLASPHRDAHTAAKLEQTHLSTAAAAADLSSTRGSQAEEEEEKNVDRARAAHEKDRNRFRLPAPPFKPPFFSLASFFLRRRCTVIAQPAAYHDAKLIGDTGRLGRCRPISRRFERCQTRLCARCYLGWSDLTIVALALSGGRGVQVEVANHCAAATDTQSVNCVNEIIFTA